MLEHLKRILIQIVEWHLPYVIWNTVTDLGIAGSDDSGQHIPYEYDELTILHYADQAGTLNIYMSAPAGTATIVDTIAYAANEVISKVYSITGYAVLIQCVNGAVAQTDRVTYCTVRRT